MKLHTFTGFATNGLDIAIADAHRDYDQWLSDNCETITTMGQPVITATIRPADVEGIAEYWFTITLSYAERGMTNDAEDRSNRKGW